MTKEEKQKELEAGKNANVQDMKSRSDANNKDNAEDQAELEKLAKEKEIFGEEG